MTNAKYVCFNGEFRLASEPILLTQNRAFRFGDALYENMHVFATRAQLLEHHYNRLLCAMNLLYMEKPARMTLDYLDRTISQLLNRNRIFGGGFVRLTLYRNEGGFVAPGGNQVDFVLESQPLQADGYVLNEKGFVIDICTDYTVHTGPLAGIKSTGSLLYVLTGLYCERNHLDDAILLNESGRIVGSYRSNIFLVKGSYVFTPGLDQGCIPGIMRRFILKLSADSGLRINDLSSLTPAALEDADEVFFTNALEGIRWVGAYKQRRYYKKTAQQLCRTLNDKVLSERSL